MDNASFQWTWDAARRQHFYWSTAEDCFVYSNGLRLNRNYEVIPSQNDNNNRAEDQPRSTAYTHSPHLTTQSTIANPYSSPNQSPEYHHATPAAGAQVAQNSTPLVYQQPQQEQNSVQRNILISGETHQDLLTDPSLASLNGPYASRRLGGTTGTVETLDPRYRIRYPGSHFFTVGKVFKVLWPEIAGDANRGITVATVSFGAQVALKIRWFAVIREGHNCCSCLPIQTYGQQGVAKHGLIKGQHAIIYTGSEPAPYQNESPANETEAPMLGAIRVKNLSPADRLDRLSRINFAKIYTVEHNVKVYEFGEVHPNWLPRFQAHFQTVWRLGGG